MPNDDRAERFFRSIAGIPDLADDRLPSGRLELPEDDQDQRVYPVSLVRDEPPDNDPRRETRYFPNDPPIDPAALERLERRLTEDGIDALAVYAPFTFWGDRWGIYYFVNRIYEFAELLARDDPRLRWDGRELLDTLLAKIQEHERLHFRVELAAMHHRAATGFDHYRLYWSRFAWAARGSDGAEEAVATALGLALCRARNPRLARALKARTALLPRGYRDHGKYQGPTGQGRGLGILSARLLGHPDRPIRTSAELMQRDVADLYLGSVPEYFVREGRLPAWFEDLLAGQRYRQLTLRDVRRHAERNAEVKPAGNHQWKVYRPNKRPVPLQDHPRINKAIPPHIVGELADLFDLSRNDYVEAVLAM